MKTILVLVAFRGVDEIDDHKSEAANKGQGEEGEGESHGGWKLTHYSLLPLRRPYGSLRNMVYGITVAFKKAPNPAARIAMSL